MNLVPKLDFNWIKTINSPNQLEAKPSNFENSRTSYLHFVSVCFWCIQCLFLLVCLVCGTVNLTECLYCYEKRKQCWINHWNKLQEIAPFLLKQIQYQQRISWRNQSNEETLYRICRQRRYHCHWSLSRPNKSSQTANKTASKLPRPLQSIRTFSALIRCYPIYTENRI